MAQVIIRNLDDSVVERLKQRARLNGKSLEAELRSVLERESRPKTMEEFKSTVEEFHKLIAGRKHTDSVKLLREDRGR